MRLGYIKGQHKQMHPDGYSLPEFKKVYSKWDKVFSENGWGTIYLGNHDQPRMLSRWGNDTPEYREASSKLLTTFLLTMQATTYYYAGDEIGMSNIKFDSIEDYRDIDTINYYQKLQNEKGDITNFLNGQKIAARDNGRTPFQWDDTENAGFTKGTPWIKINPDYTTINVATEEKIPDSTLHYFRKMVQLRKALPELIYGSYVLLDEDNQQIYAYMRSRYDRKVLVIMNFSNLDADFYFNESIGNIGELLINNMSAYNCKKGHFYLKPWQALIVRIL